MRFVGHEAIEAVRRRFVRNVLALISVVLGVAGLVASVGLSATSSRQIEQQFVKLQARDVVLSGFDATSPYAATAVERISRIPGVQSCRVYRSTEQNQVDVTVLPGDTDSQAPVMALAAGADDALGIEIEYGRTFDAGTAERMDDVVLVGKVVAGQLGLSVDSLGSIVFVGGQPRVLAGVVSSSEPLSIVPYSVLIPDDPDLALPLTDPLVAVRTDPGVAGGIGDALALALRPENPDAVSGSSAPSPENLRASITEETASLVRVLGAVLLGVGAFGIANTLLLGVLERRFEIGVRRTVGTSSTQVLAQFLLEGLLVGMIGGSLGVIVGVCVVDVVSIVQSAQPVIPFLLVIAGPAVGSVVGLLAAGYPASRAARIQPAEALRS